MHMPQNLQSDVYAPVNMGVLQDQANHLSNMVSTLHFDFIMKTVLIASNIRATPHMTCVPCLSVHDVIH